MKAIVQDRYGGPDVLHLDDIAAPSPGPGGVLLRVYAAGLDRGVLHLMEGQPTLMRVLGFGLRGPKARVRGREVAGRVEASGQGVTRFKLGDEVFGICDGSFAEFAVGREDKIAPKPKNLSFEQAAAVPISAITALQAVRRGHIEAGMSVLVIGASGGVGSFAVQLSKAFGAKITGVCSATKIDLVRRIGADTVIDYTRQDIMDAGQRFDVIIDIAGNRSLTHLRRALAPQGTLVIVGGEGGGRVFGGTGRNLLAAMLNPFVRQKLTAFITKEGSEDLVFLKGLIEAGKIMPVIDRTFPLEEVPKAVRYLEDGHAQGKVVITV